MIIYICLAVSFIFNLILLLFIVKFQDKLGELENKLNSFPIPITPPPTTNEQTDNFDELNIHFQNPHTLPPKLPPITTTQQFSITSPPLITTNTAQPNNYTIITDAIDIKNEVNSDNIIFTRKEIDDMKKESSLKLYGSFDELKADRVERPLTEEEKLRQEKATESLKKLKPVSDISGNMDALNKNYLKGKQY